MTTPLSPATPKLFISYRRDDSEHVTGRIYDRLEAHFGRDNVFLDIDTIPFGVDFREHLDQAVSRCDVLLAIIGDQWLDIRHQDGPKQGQQRLDDAADFVRIEILAALTRKIPVIPVLVGRGMMPGEQDLPVSLRGLAFRNASEVRSGRDFRDHTERLIRGIEYLMRKVQGNVRPALPREIANSIGMKFVLIPAGTFLMGSPDSEHQDVLKLLDQQQMPDWLKAEGPQHEVEITRPFYMSVYPVTVAQFRVFVTESGYRTQAEKEGGANRWTRSKWELDADMNWKNPGWQLNDDDPVTCVSWNDADAFLKWLSERPLERAAARTYRLPSEAEWEYSCRGRAPSYQVFHFGNSLSSKQANFNGNYPYGGADTGPYLERTCKVGSYPVNDFGLCDMHGNVWEWCADWYDEDYYATSPRQDPPGPASAPARVLRGGSWRIFGRFCRSASRVRYEPDLRYHYFGFRLAAVPSLEPSKTSEKA